MNEVPSPFQKAISAEIGGLYPELSIGGSLAEAIRRELGSTCDQAAGFELKGFEELLAEGSPFWASIKSQNRSGQLNVAVHDRLFMCSLNECQIQLAKAATADLTQLVLLLKAWFIDQKSAVDVSEQFLFATVNLDTLRTYEAGPEVWVQSAWHNLMGWVEREATRGDRFFERQLPLIRRAAAHQSLKRLCPFTSHDALHLCHNLSTQDSTGYPVAAPYHDDSFLENQIYQVYDRDGAPGGHGDASWAVEFLVANLPVFTPPFFEGGRINPETGMKPSE